MQVDSAPPSAPYTILRIKRKRNEEPLDALVVETRRKKSRGGAGVFQYAQTVDAASWDTGAQQRDIQEQISRLAREPVVPPPQIPPTSPVRSSADEMSRRYTIVEHNVPRPSTKGRFLTEPPKVISAKELEKGSSTDFKMFDAVPEKKQVPKESDSEMDKFLPMLNEYLKIHDTDIGPKNGSIKPGASPMIGTPNADEGASDDDYVYDVFYHRPQTLAGWNNAINVATVTGLPPSYNDEYDTPSDSEEELDEADEDSNAEEYYKNDYPDEEDLSDEWHDDNEDAFGYEDSNDDYDF
ncbi:hypothetical protein CVT24_010952 [Panaeolus cyanescens]|uniref:Probable RNA polymerase II nuclear localization protein SLC7A6OS n=1 Tax=Panaeolus cyanescens TaxID=181874 RepID=A0A409YVS5_9AGAR|nr:hypothetical protein CVT24_010952 [Panaeolus cyanescens]